MLDFWDNSTLGLDMPPYMDGSFVAIANTIGGLTPQDAILYLPLNAAYGIDNNHCVWFQFDIQFSASGQVSWAIWDVNCPATNLSTDYHATSIQIPYLVGDNYHWALITSGSNTVTFSINNTNTGSSWSINNWFYTVPSTNLLALENTFSPSSTVEGYTSSATNLTQVPLFKTIVGKGVVADRYYSQSDAYTVFPAGITTGRYLLDSGHWVWEMSPAGTILVDKRTTGGDGTFYFNSTGGGGLPQRFSLYTLNGIGNTTLNNILPGTYSISETVPTGWSLVASTCSTGLASSFTVSARTVTCVFRNQAVGTVVIKKTITGGGDGLFNFTSSSSRPGFKVLPSSFSIRTTGGSGNATFLNVDANLAYTVSEVLSTSWALIGSSCTVGSPSSFIVAGAGQMTVCTFDDENSSIPDVAVTAIAMSRPFAYSGVVLPHPIAANVTVANLSGGRSQTFTVSIYYNSTQIGGTAGGKTITLNAGASQVLTFDWYANSTTHGRDTIWAHVSSVPGETNVANNDLTLGYYFQVRKAGDVDGDGTVDITDLILVWQNQFTTVQSSPYDIDGDGVVDITDLIITWAHQFT